MALFCSKQFVRGIYWWAVICRLHFRVCIVSASDSYLIEHLNRPVKVQSCGNSMATPPDVAFMVVWICCDSKTIEECCSQFQMSLSQEQTMSIDREDTASNWQPSVEEYSTNESPADPEEHHHKYCIHNVRKRQLQTTASPSLKKMVRSLRRSLSPAKGFRRLVAMQRFVQKCFSQKNRGFTWVKHCVKQRLSMTVVSIHPNVKWYVHEYNCVWYKRTVATTNFCFRTLRRHSDVMSKRDGDWQHWKINNPLSPAQGYVKWEKPIFTNVSNDTSV